MTFAERRDAARMTATERLRQLLDERGVEWESAHEWEGRTFWPNADGVNATASDYGSGLLVHAVMSPEQAVEATLGRGTCRVEGSIDYGEFGCWQYDLSCGCRILWPDSEPPTFCPECGRRVEE